jgi:hypothetical protein
VWAVEGSAGPLSVTPRAWRSDVGAIAEFRHLQASFSFDREDAPIEEREPWKGLTK